MSHIPDFDQLVASAERIARHAPFPGKHQAIDLAIEDIDDLALLGMIDDEQRDQLREILLGGCPHAA